MKLNRNVYLLIGGIIIFSVVVFYIAKQNSSPVNNYKPISILAQSSQAPNTSQDTSKLKKSIEANIATQLGNRASTYVKDVQASPHLDGGYDVRVDVNEDPTMNGRIYRSFNLASIYIAVYRVKSTSIQNVSVLAHFPPHQDQYGNMVETPIMTTSLDKTTADKFNWNLDDNQLNLFIASELRKSFPQLDSYYTL